MKKETKDSSSKLSPVISAICFIAVAVFAFMFIGNDNDSAKDSSSAMGKSELKADDFGLKLIRLYQVKPLPEPEFSIEIADTEGNIHGWSEINDKLRTPNGNYTLKGVDSENGLIIVARRHPMLSGIILKTISMDATSLSNLLRKRVPEINAYLANASTSPDDDMRTILNELNTYDLQINSLSQRLQRKQVEIQGTIENLKKNQTLQNAPIPSKYTKQLSKIAEDLNTLKKISSKVGIPLSEMKARAGT